MDTIAAGDTFNAGIIHRLSLSGGVSGITTRGGGWGSGDVVAALEFACRLAGAKCGMQGLLGLRDYPMEF